MPDAKITLIEDAALDMDWQQVVQNGGPPCFHLENGRFCGRAERWEGHVAGGKYPNHTFISLFTLIGEVHQLGMES